MRGWIPAGGRQLPPPSPALSVEGSESSLSWRNIAVSSSSRAVFGTSLVRAWMLARARLAERGFNQCVEIARYIAADFGLRLSTDVCRRTRDASPQATLPWKLRTSNVRNSFACDQDLQGKSVAVIDDVRTTGASLNELARTLKLRGAQTVTGWIVARTLAPGDA